MKLLSMIFSASIIFYVDEYILSPYHSVSSDSFLNNTKYD